MLEAARSNSRFSTLDALRGVAAIAVMIYHAIPGGAFAMPGGYLAVDLFFAISGFVIAHSYARRMADGFAPGEFLRLRVARLWPMLFLGALLGIALHGGHAGMLFLLPNPLSQGLLFPANPPLWSLLAEFAAYAAFAVLLWRLPSLALLAICALAGTALTVFALGPLAFEGFGADWRALLPGAARTTYAFVAGMLVWRLHETKGLKRRSSALAWLLPLGFVGLLALAPGSNEAALLIALVAVPTFVWLASHWELPQSRVAENLGDMSYPLYCIHVPLLASLAAFDVAPLVACSALIPLAWALDRHADRPLRAILKKYLLTPRPAATA